MSSFVTIAIALALIVVFALSVFIPYKISHKKHKKEIQEREAKYEQLESTLQSTNQHLKYKYKIALQTFISSFADLLFALNCIFFVTLPIFKIDLKLFEIPLKIKNFSFLDNYYDLKNTYDEANKVYTDIDYDNTIFIFNFIIIALSTIFILFVIFDLIKLFNIKKNTSETYIYAKIDKKNYLGASTIGTEIIIIALLIFQIFECRNAEFENYKINNCTPKIIDNFIYYYNSDGNFILKVLQNDFKFCNGISGYIAIPIISFVVGLVLYFVGQHLKRKLVAEIQNEKLNEPQAVETTNENDNIE